MNPSSIQIGTIMLLSQLDPATNSNLTIGGASFLKINLYTDNYLYFYGQGSFCRYYGNLVNTWTHVVMVFTQSNVNLYYNGVNQSWDYMNGFSSDYRLKSTYNNGSYPYFYMGTNKQTGQYFNGGLRDFRYFDSGLSQSEVTALYNSTLLLNQFTFANSTVDVVGSTTVSVTGAPSYTTGPNNLTAITLSNTSGAVPSNGIKALVSLGAYPTFSITAWVYFRSVDSTYADYLSFGNNTSGANIWFACGSLNTLNVTINDSSSYTISTSYTATANTWYHITFTLSSNGTCNFYVNGTLIGSHATTSFSSNLDYLSIGSCMLANSTFSYSANVNMADVRVYSGILTSSQINSIYITQPYIQLPFENSYTDIIGNSTITTSGSGSVAYVTGIVGSTAINLANTSGSNASICLRGTLAVASLPNFTITGWFNLQSYGGWPTIIAINNEALVLYIDNGSHKLYATIPTGGGTSGQFAGGSGSAVSLNTWYFFSVVFQTNGLCSVYLNNTLTGSYTNSGGFGTSTGNSYSVGSYVSNTSQAFNGYIDDIRIYNYALTTGQLNSLGAYYNKQYPPAALTNYTTALSGQSYGNGSYIITTSSDYGVTESAYYAFDRNNATWWTNSYAYMYSGSYSRSPPTTTTVSGNSYSGEWLQIQMPTPIILSNYTLYSHLTDYLRSPKDFIIAGSTNGTTWVTIDIQSNIIWSAASGKSFTTNSSVYYSYFRMISLSNNGSGWLSIAEWVINGREVSL
jgi:hypothetical protein